MRTAIVFLLGAVVGSLTLACSSQPPTPLPAKPPPPVASPTAPKAFTLETATAAARADAARQAGVTASSLTLLSAEAVTWPDGSLGCPKAGMAYQQVLVPGFRIRLRGPAGELDYHASARGGLVLCPAKRATEPVPGGGFNSRV